VTADPFLFSGPRKNAGCDSPWHCGDLWFINVNHTLHGLHGSPPPRSAPKSHCRVGGSAVHTVVVDRSGIGVWQCMTRLRSTTCGLAATAKEFPIRKRPINITRSFPKLHKGSSLFPGDYEITAASNMLHGSWPTLENWLKVHFHVSFDPAFFSIKVVQNKQWSINISQIKFMFT
jgi:hypothetical protein